MSYGLALLAGLAMAGCVFMIISGPGSARARLAGHTELSSPGIQHSPALSWRIRLPTAVAAGGGLWWLIGVPWGALIAVPVALGVFVALARFVPAETARRREQLILQLPAALDLLAGCLSAGLPLRQALLLVVPLTTDLLTTRFKQVLLHLELGDDDLSAWQVLANDDQLGRLARDAARSARTGAPLADLLRTHAEQARRNRHGVLRSRARAIGVRSVLPVTLCFLPAFMLIGVVPIVAGAISALLRP